MTHTYFFPFAFAALFASSLAFRVALPFADWAYIVEAFKFVALPFADVWYLFVDAFRLSDLLYFFPFADSLYFLYAFFSVAFPAGVA